MSCRIPTRAMLVAMSLVGAAALDSTGAPGLQIVAVARAQAETPTIDVGAIFKLLDTDATRAKGLKQLADAAAAGEAAAMSRLALVQINGEFGTTADRTKGLDLLEQAAAKGDSSAKVNLALILLGDPAGDASRPVKLLEEAAATGDAWATTTLAALYLDGKSLPADGNRVLELVQPLADKHDVSALTVLGDLYAHGAGSVASEPAKAEAAYSAAGEKGDGQAISKFGHFLLDSGRDAEKGIALLEQSAASGNSWTLVTLGDVYAAGKLVPADGEEAADYYADAFAAGVAYASTRLGDLYRTGAGTLPADMVKAGAAYEAAAEMGDNTGRVNFALLLLSGALPPDPERAIAVLKAAADTGDGWATTTLGSVYLDGKAVPADGEKVLAIAGPLADAGSAAALTVIGDLYRLGAGTVAADPAWAREYYKQALDKGDGQARVKLGDMLVAGEGGTADAERGLALLNAAADAGDSWEMVLIGNLYAEGRYLPADAAKAAEYYRRSFEAGVGYAATLLGNLYTSGGPNLEANPTEARRYYEAAAAAGDGTAKVLLANILVSTRDPAEGERGRALLQEAADNNSGWAASVLAAIYAQGQGVTADYERARTLSALAESQGDRDAMLRFAVMVANGPLAADHRADGNALIDAALAAGKSSAAIELARLQVAGLVEGKGPADAVNVLEAAAKDGDKEAVKYLLQLYRVGSGSALAPQPAKGKAVLKTHAELFSESELALQSLLIESSNSSAETLGRLGGYYARLSATDRRQALDILFFQNQNAYTYIVQKELTERGLFTGRVNGLMTNATISAIAKACTAVGRWSECSAGPLTQAASGVMASYLFDQPG